MATKFVTNLLAQFWSKYKRDLVLRMFTPFLLYSIISVLFMYLMLEFLINNVQDDEADDLDDENDGTVDDSLPGYIIVLGMVNMVFWAYLIYLEYR